MDGRLMDGFARGAIAVSAGYLVVLAVADAAGRLSMSWVVVAIGGAGVLGAVAGIRALPRPMRFLCGAASTIGFTVLGALAFPVTSGLLLGAALAGAGTMSLFEARDENALPMSSSR
jgi:hypothetical protein